MMIPCKALHWSGLVMAHYWHVMNDWISQLLILEYFFFFKKRSDRCSLWIKHHCLIGLGEIGLVDPDFCRKCPFSSAKKWDFCCRNKKMETTFQCQHPPKMVNYLFVLCVYHFWVDSITVSVFVIILRRAGLSTFGWVLNQFLKIAYFLLF